MKNKTKTLIGLTSIVAAGTISLVSLIPSSSNQQAKQAKTISTPPQTTISTTEPIDRPKTEIIYFHFKAPDAIESVYVVDANGKRLAAIIERGKDCIDIQKQKYNSGGNYERGFYDISVLEGRGTIEIPYTPKVQLSINLLSGDSYTESTVIDNKTEERMKKRIEKSLENLNLGD